jgi:hypothetical protein
MVTITEDGVGALFVDGDQQQLVIANNLLNLAEGFTNSIGDTFNTEVYPNKLVSVAAKRRNLLQVRSSKGALCTPLARYGTSPPAVRECWRLPSVALRIPAPLPRDVRAC